MSAIAFSVGLFLGLIVVIAIPLVSKGASIGWRDRIFRAHVWMAMKGFPSLAVLEQSGYHLLTFSYKGSWDEWKAKIRRRKKFFDDNSGLLRRCCGTLFGVLHNDVGAFLSPRVAEVSEAEAEKIERGEHELEEPKKRKIKGGAPGKRKGEVVERDEKGNKIYESKWNYDIELPAIARAVDLSQVKRVFRHGKDPKVDTIIAQLVIQSQSGFGRPSVGDLMIIIIAFAAGIGPFYIAGEGSGGGVGGGGVPLPTPFSVTAWSAGMLLLAIPRIEWRRIGRVLVTGLLALFGLGFLVLGAYVTSWWLLPGFVVGLLLLPLLAISPFGRFIGGTLLRQATSVTDRWVGLETEGGYRFAIAREAASARYGRGVDAPGYEYYLDGEWRPLKAAEDRWGGLAGAAFCLAWDKTELAEAAGVAADGGETLTLDVRDELRRTVNAGSPKIVETIADDMLVKHVGGNSLSNTGRTIAAFGGLVLGVIVGYVVF